MYPTQLHSPDDEGKARDGVTFENLGLSRNRQTIKQESDKFKLILPRTPMPLLWQLKVHDKVSTGFGYAPFIYLEQVGRKLTAGLRLPLRGAHVTPSCHLAP